MRVRWCRALTACVDRSLASVEMACSGVGSYYETKFGGTEHPGIFSLAPDRLCRLFAVQWKARKVEAHWRAREVSAGEQRRVAELEETIQ